MSRRRRRGKLKPGDLVVFRSGTNVKYSSSMMLELSMLGIVIGTTALDIYGNKECYEVYYFNVNGYSSGCVSTLGQYLRKVS